VVIAHDRADCLEKCLASLVPQRDLAAFALAVSLDAPASFVPMEAVVKRFRAHAAIDVWRKTANPPGVKAVVTKISEHFRFALTESFDKRGFEFAIFLENDLVAAPDFLWYFRVTAPLLEQDPSLFCVSAWNDNGFPGLVSNERRLFRTDYFPGLGWLIRNETWAKLRHKWPRFPSTGWDHWLRHGSGLRPRECIVPEVPRTHHFDTRGTNVKKGSALEKMLSTMVESKLPAGALGGDLSYLLKERYEQELLQLLRGAKVLRPQQIDMLPPGPKASSRVFVVPYAREEYKDLAKRLQLCPAQPRTAHRGIVLTRHRRTGAVLALVDRRQGEGVLQPEELWQPRAGRRVAKAEKGESCDGLCRRLGMRCEARELEFVNNCETMLREFPCEDGCGHQVGKEIPCYVHDATRDTALQCLITDDALPTCEARIPATTRLCACVPA